MEENSLKKPELLAPAQDWNSLKLIPGLADAIYFGTSDYNMRRNANNFKREELPRIAEYCHEQNPRIKAYLATNILIYDTELRDLEELISEGKGAGIDAIIAHDIATIRFAKQFSMPFHVSTQVNVSNTESAKFYEQLGAERIILSRELSLNQIKLIKHHLTKSKIETFIHGSMCTSISGRCYFSADIMNSSEFSANRGNCVQPCRRTWTVIDDENHEYIYDGQLFLNAKDLCMIEYIPELIEAKIDAFKIEGRMKDPLYVKTVLQCYREAIDSYFNNSFTKEKVVHWMESLNKVYNRGFHTGFYFGTPTITDIQHAGRGNMSEYKKHYIGKVVSFDDMSKSANVLVENFDVPFKLGDQILIIGKKTYKIERIRTMIYKGEKIKSIARKRFSDSAVINLRIDQCEIDDKIYIITKA
jgi:putative protease